MILDANPCTMLVHRTITISLGSRGEINQAWLGTNIRYVCICLHLLGKYVCNKDMLEG